MNVRCYSDALVRGVSLFFFSFIPPHNGIQTRVFDDLLPYDLQTFKEKYGKGRLHAHLLSTRNEGRGCSAWFCSIWRIGVT